MPALRAAKSDKDLEIRTRATAILGRIEGTLLVQPTSIDLDFRDVRMPEALRSINARTGLSLTAASDDDPAWSETRFTLDPGTQLRLEGDRRPLRGRPGPLCRRRPDHTGAGPFHLLDSSGLFATRADLGCRPFPRPARRRPFPERGPALPNPAGSGGRDDRPRVAVAPPRGVASATKQLYLQLLVAAEPRLSIAQNGPVRVSEAFDEEGRSILIPARQAAIQHSSGYFGMNPSPVLRLRVDLAHPEGTGRRIKRIKGTIPVAVATRKPDSLLVPLDRPVGQTSRNDEVAVTVREVRPARQNQPASIELSLRNASGPIAPGEGFEGDVLPYRPESSQQQLEVLDAQGRSLPWFPKGLFFNGEETRLTMTILPADGAGPPASIRHHGMIRGSTEIVVRVPQRH